VLAFNVAMMSTVGSVGGLVYLATGGAGELSPLVGASQIIVKVGLPLMTADVAQCATNAVLLSGVMRVANGVPMRTQIWKLISVTGIAYVGYGVIGFLFVVLWIPARVGAFSAALVLAPLFVARWAFVQYGDELRAHERTLRALVTAVETKEPHNVGHSERVAQLSEWVAEVLGLGHKEIQDVRTAGMLHDVGKVGVPTRLLRTRQPLGDDDLVVIADHALGGVELVEGIDFLSGSVPGIAHHHERFDGRGYPAGLAGEAIPLPARIVAAADVFDCLTSARAYREALSTDEALAVLTQSAGSQFDPQVVEALVKALARHQWTPTQRSGELLASAGVALDHDEPEVSDMLAERPDLRSRIKGARALVRVPVKELS
jgi:HD-GYP domain-containing protein (c-di-GMP phosphodiesterase class II)